MKIIKRSGAENTFDKEKIENAVAKANITVEEKDRLSEGEIGEIAQNIEDKCSEMNRAMDVETIQDWVERRYHAPRQIYSGKALYHLPL